MLKRLISALAFAVFALPAPVAWADEYTDTMNLFRNAGESAHFFNNAYGYAVFPTIGKAGLGVGGAHGKGRVYVGGRHVGDTKVTQLSIGLQAGAQAYSQIIFLEDKRAFDEFSSGNFEFGANASAGGFHKGMAVFTVAKGGLMYEAAIGGQKFSYTAR